MTVYKRNLYRNEGEILTGQVQDKPASDIEERSARAIDKTDWDYTFRVRIDPRSGGLTERFRNIAGEYEIDFLCHRGSQLLPILVDGEVSHFLASWQKVQDEQREAVINAALESFGAMPVVRVEFWHLSDQASANRLYRELLL